MQKPFRRFEKAANDLLSIANASSFTKPDWPSKATGFKSCTQASLQTMIWTINRLNISDPHIKLHKYAKF